MRLSSLANKEQGKYATTLLLHTSWMPDGPRMIGENDQRMIGENDRYF